MQSDLTYFVWMLVAATAVAITTLGLAAWVHFSEDRWGRRPGDVADTDDRTDAGVTADAQTHEEDRAA